ncbi:hypothetical protein RB6495 [Rhodopirellula baltica SH 1]|uniref:Uncharacterized protein n=1 Tax=Rhodopirellula baltica (strain DSM 10527 / NCIMB 13988 / SH1) TaxID=243090 RepID=Q7UQ65_RHOBA|nr:hypothetical protein RB6495 [Rhodopirellula baltica SH 1]
MKRITQQLPQTEFGKGFANPMLVLHWTLRSARWWRPLRL